MIPNPASVSLEDIAHTVHSENECIAVAVALEYNGSLAAAYTEDMHEPVFQDHLPPDTVTGQVGPLTVYSFEDGSYLVRGKGVAIPFDSEGRQAVSEAYMLCGCMAAVSPMNGKTSLDR